MSWMQILWYHHYTISLVNEHENERPSHKSKKKIESGSCSIELSCAVITITSASFAIKKFQMRLSRRAQGLRYSIIFCGVCLRQEFTFYVATL